MTKGPGVRRAVVPEKRYGEPRSTCEAVRHPFWPQETQGRSAAWGASPPRTTLLTEAGGGKCGHGGEGVGNPRRPYAACRWALAALEASPTVAMPARRPRPRTHAAKTRKHVADKTCPRLFAAACSVLARRWGIPRRLATAG